MDRLTEVKNLEKKIISKETEIEKLEGEILSEEHKIIKTENKISKLAKLLAVSISKFPASRVNVLRLRVVQRFNKHKVLYSFVTLLSIVLIWTGLQTFITKTPGISNPLIAIPAGLLIVWIIDRELA